MMMAQTSPNAPGGLISYPQIPILSWCRLSGPDSYHTSLQSHEWKVFCRQGLFYKDSPTNLFKLVDVIEVDGARSFKPLTVAIVSPNVQFDHLGGRDPSVETELVAGVLRHTHRKCTTCTTISTHSLSITALGGINWSNTDWRDWDWDACCLVPSPISCIWPDHWRHIPDRLSYVLI